MCTPEDLAELQRHDEEVRARFEDLEAKLQRVRVLHSRVGDLDECNTCPEQLGYPCPTIRAVDLGVPGCDAPIVSEGLR